MQVRQCNQGLAHGKADYLTELADAYAQLTSSSEAPAQVHVMMSCMTLAHVTGCCRRPWNTMSSLHST